MNRIPLVVLLALVPACRLFSSTIVCASDAECPRDAVCAGGICVAEGEGEGGVEGEGGAGEGEGAPIPCADDSACPAADGCADGFCAARCNDDGDCRTSEFCKSIGFFPVETVCISGCRIDHDAGTDNCGGGDVCSTGTHHCVTAQPSPRGQDGLCAGDVECAAGLGCFIFDGEDRGYCSEKCEFKCQPPACCPNSGLDRCEPANLCGEDCVDTDCPGPNCCPFTGFARCEGGACYP